MSSCTFLAFSDLHYHPEVFPHDAPGYLAQILNRAEKENVSFVVQLGDFLHIPESNSSLIDVYHNHPLPTYCAFGNHDTDQENMEYILQMYKLEKNYYYFERDGYRFIVLDANYFQTEDGSIIHYVPLVRRPHQLGMIPVEELQWLEETISTSSYPCILLSHQSLERTDGISNRDAVWKIICRANGEKEHSVILCINGHYHSDYCTIVNDVCCLDLNSSSYHWTDVQNTICPDEFAETYKFARNIFVYDKPLSAVITLEGTERITVSGAKGNFRFFPSEEEILRTTQNRRLCMDRKCVPYISDYSIDLKTNTVKRIRQE